MYPPRMSTPMPAQPAASMVQFPRAANPYALPYVSGARGGEGGGEAKEYRSIEKKK